MHLQFSINPLHTGHFIYTYVSGSWNIYQTKQELPTYLFQWFLKHLPNQAGVAYLAAPAWFGKKFKNNWPTVSVVANFWSLWQAGDNYENI
jgi:hypothetical protein